MEIKDFIEKFAEALELDTPDVCTPEMDFRKLDAWNSLAVLSIIAMADEEYNVVIKGDDIRNAKTIQDLFNLIESKTV